jgi:hypothetical protein
MRKETVRLWSVNGNLLRHITLTQALEMLGETLSGDSIENVYPSAVRISRKKAKLADIRLMALERNEKPSACTLKMSDMVNNGIGAANPQLRKMGREGGRVSTLKIGNYIDRAMSKVEAWPEAHDTRNTVISAGTAFGVFCPWPVVAERVLTFS